MTDENVVSGFFGVVRILRFFNLILNTAKERKEQEMQPVKVIVGIGATGAAIGAAALTAKSFRRRNSSSEKSIQEISSMISRMVERMGKKATEIRQQLIDGKVEEAGKRIEQVVEEIRSDLDGVAARLRERIERKKSARAHAA